ncbi:MAG: 3-phosphoshikimate 1-carboxyvinyltransferase [Bacteroidales bacterium]
MIKYYVSKPDQTLNGEITLSPTKPLNHKFLTIRILRSSNLTQQITTETEDSRIIDKNLLSEVKKNRGSSAKAIRHIRSFINYFGGEWTISSSDFIKDKPIAKIAKVLQKFGLNVSFEERLGRPPLKIIGKNLQGKILRVDGSINSKVIEAKLLLSDSIQNETIAELKDRIIQSGYVMMTLKALQYLGVNTEWKEEDILVEHETKDGSELVIESDWSMASYWYQMVALAQKGSITLEGLNPESFQCDSVTKDIFKQFGVETQINPDSIKIKRKGKTVKKFTHNFANHPDLIPACVVTCACLNIPFLIEGIESLHQKDSDRIESIKAELAKIGASIKLEVIENKERLSFDGKTKFKGLKEVTFDTHNDHRMPLSLAPICLKGINVTIENPWVTNKSYTTFWDDLKKVGFEINS